MFHGLTVKNNHVSYSNKDPKQKIELKTVTLNHCFPRHAVIICCLELNHTGSTGVFMALTICVLTPRRPVWPHLSSPSSTQLWDPSAPSSICVLVLAPKLHGCNPSRPPSEWYASDMAPPPLRSACQPRPASLGLIPRLDLVERRFCWYQLCCSHKHSSEMWCSKLQTGHFFLFYFMFTSLLI